MILVAGGTGRLGRQLVQRLLTRGLLVRVLSRNPPRAVQPASTPLEWVQGDVRSRQSVERAMTGVDTVVSAVHGFAGSGGVSPASVDRDGNRNLTDVATSANATVVLMSVVGASAQHPMELFRMKYAAEQHLRASRAAWTIVRSTAFLETWLALFEQTAGRSGRPLVFGRGENRINFVSSADVAGLVEQAVIDPGTRGTILEIGGPENLSMNELAARAQAATGRNRAPRHVPRAALRAMALALRRLRPDLARQAAAALAMDTVDLTFEDVSAHLGPGTTLAQVLGSRHQETV